MSALNEIEVIVIGGSAGALDALGVILPALPHNFGPTIVVVLHVPASRPSLLPNVLSARCPLPVREPDDKEPLARGHVYVAAPGYHLLIEKERTFAFSIDDLVLFSRPSIDVLFESAANAVGPKLAGVLLTGSSEDGARGLDCIKGSGGMTIVQAANTAAVPTMPEAGLRLAKVDHVLPLAEIGPFLARLGAQTLEVA